MPNFETVRFGKLAYHAEDIIHFPEGLVGMPDLRDWLVLEMGDDLPMKWFQSLDRGDFGFPVSQPAFFADTYDLTIPPEVSHILRGREGEWLAIMIITTIHADGTRITGNMLAPLVVNVDTRQGLQLVMNDEGLSVRQEINYLKFGLAVDGYSAENDHVAAGSGGSVQDPVGEFSQDLLDSPAESGQSEIRSEVEKPEPAGV